MPDKFYYSYIRVSTLRQGQTGTSLDEQREAIKRYAGRNQLTISQEFEEQETAAKLGRPVFDRMLKGLQKGKAQGVIIHKIDRSARNLKDWANLGELIDQGIDVHFANESLDLQSRGGRLSADIQAVIASDYIRNLREEVKKGFYGRIKQGFYPRPAPIGYLDQGQGKAKLPDPIRGPLVRKMFELYATGRYGIPALTEHMYTLGLRNRQGKRLVQSSVAKCLHNPFYLGLIHIKTRDELYPGAHPALISKTIFDKVQAVSSGKAVKGTGRHDFLFRKTLRCATCQTTLIGERQKGYIYYRCHTTTCPEKTIREEVVEDCLMGELKAIRFNGEETQFLKNKIETMYYDAQIVSETQKKALQLQLEQLQVRLSKLTDAYLDGMIEQGIYLEKKNAYIVEEKIIKEQLTNVDQKQPQLMRQLEQFLELVNNAYLSYELANVAEKRELVKITTLNLNVTSKNVLVTLKFPFQVVANRQNFIDGGPSRGTPRTFDRLLADLIEYFSHHEPISLSTAHSYSSVTKL